MKFPFNEMPNGVRSLVVFLLAVRPASDQQTAGSILSRLESEGLSPFETDEERETFRQLWADPDVKAQAVRYRT